MKYKSKSDFINDSNTAWASLWEQVNQIPSTKLETRTGSPKRSVTDVLAHLYDWQRLAIGWYRDGEKGRAVHLPAKGYKWNQLKEMNARFYESHKDDSFVSISRRLKRSHNQLMKIASGLSQTELLQPGQFDWTRKLAIASYLGPNMASHYRWAIKKIKSMKLSG